MHSRDMIECVGKSSALKNVQDVINTIAPRQCTIVLIGESGTGKELFARQIHLKSQRASGPFIPVDCTNLSGDLFASQLFGHLKGAFTGAERDTLGFFRAANGGTILLDEIGELSRGAQAKLLRVLQESKVTPVGSASSYPVDVRLICATNKNLEDMVKKGTFRRDFYYRINVVRICIQPLRERREDIIPLAEHFLEQQARLYNEPVKKLDPQAKEYLLRYSWPGNVRQVANVMEQVHVLTNSRIITPSLLPLEILMESSDSAPNRFPTMDEATRNLILAALRHAGGRKRKTAKLLGIDHRRLNRMMANLGIKVPAQIESN